MLLHPLAKTSQLEYLRVCQTVGFTQSSWCIYSNGALAAGLVTRRMTTDRMCLVAQCAITDAQTVAEILEHKAVWVDDTADNCLAKAPRGVDDHLVGGCRHGVACKKDTSCRGCNHTLDRNGQVDIRVGKVVVVTVGHSTRRPKRSPAGTDSVNQSLGAADTSSVSCRPANDASARSSAVPEDRTATNGSSPFPASCA